MADGGLIEYAYETVNAARKREMQVENHERALAAIERNLFELELDPSVTLARATTFEGATARQLGAALDNVNQLWDHAATYRDAVHAARSLLDADDRPRAERMADLDRLLTGRSIVIAAATVPVLMRTLTGPSEAERRVTLTELLDSMEAAFDDARHAVSEIDRAWSDVRTGEAELSRRLAALRPRVDQSRQPVDVTELSDQLAAASALGPTDPIGARQRLSELRHQLADAAEQVDRSELRREAIVERLATATQAFAAIVGIAREAEALRQRCADEIADGMRLTADPPRAAEIEPIAERLDAVEQACAADEWTACDRELDRLEPRIQRLRERAGVALATNRASLTERNELIELLADAETIAATMPRDAEPIRELAARAHVAVHTTPCDLGQARELVHRVVAAVRNGRIE